MEFRFKDVVKSKIVLQEASHGFCIVAGSTLEGKVHFEIEQSLPPMKLALLFIGREKVSTTKRIITKSDIILRDVEHGPISPGTYIFPFEVSLPDSLPSTKSGEFPEFQWGVEYQLDLYAENVPLSAKSMFVGDAIKEEKDEFFINSDDSDEGEIHHLMKRGFHLASAPLQNTPVPAFKAPVLLNVGSYGGLINRGSLAIAARVLDVNVGRGTQLKVHIATRNIATTSINRVQMELIEEIFCNDELFKIDECQLVSRSKREDVELPGILKGKHHKLGKHGSSKGDEKQQILEEMKDDLFREENVINMVVPYECRDTYKGKLIRVTHTLKITMFTKALVDNPSIWIPLRIGFRPENLVTVDGPGPGKVDGTPTRISRRSSSVRKLPDMATFLEHTEAELDSDDDDAVLAPVKLAPRPSLLLRGHSMHFDEDGIVFPAPPPPAKEDLPVNPLAPSSADASLSALLEEMTMSIDDYDALSQRLEKEDDALLSNITVKQFESIVAHVKLDADRPRVASLLAQHIGAKFTCEYAEVAAKSTDWNRASIVKAILPNCVDIKTNHDIIRKSLTDWDLAVVRQDIEKAIAGDLC